MESDWFDILHHFPNAFVMEFWEFKYEYIVSVFLFGHHDDYIKNSETLEIFKREIYKVKLI